VLARSPELTALAKMDALSHPGQAHPPGLVVLARHLDVDRRSHAGAQREREPNAGGTAGAGRPHVLARMSAAIVTTLGTIKVRAFIRSAPSGWKDG